MERVGGEGRSDLDRLDLGSKLLEEFVVDGFLNENPRAGAAALTSVEAIGVASQYGWLRRSKREGELTRDRKQPMRRLVRDQHRRKQCWVTFLRVRE